MKELDNKLAYYTRLENTIISKIVEPYGLTYREYNVLRIVRMYEGMTTEEIISFTNRDHEEVLFILNALMNHKVIYEKDGCIYMHEEAKDMYKKISKEVKKHEQAVIDQMGFDNYNALISAMGKLIITLSDINEK